MAYKWKPMYENTFDSCFRSLYRVFIFIIMFLGIVLFFAGLLEEVVGIIGMGLILFFLSLYCYIGYTKKSPRKIYDVLRNKNVEFIDENHIPEDGLILIKTGKQKMGIFDINKMSFILMPDFERIVNYGNYYIVTNEQMLRGVYNKQLKKIIIPFKYKEIKIEENIIIGLNDNMKTYITPYGSIEKQEKN